MATFPVYDRSGSEVGSIDFDPATIAPKINKQLMHDAIVMYLANRRQGTFKTKSRGEISGSTKKLYRQKGTGNARVGSRRAPQRRGGGHAMQKRPRSFYFRMPKKAVRAATRMAIASKFADSEVVVINELKMEAPRTKELAGVLKSLGLEGVTTLVTLGDYCGDIHKSARNIPGVSVTRVADLNTLDVLRPKRLLFTQAAVEQIKEQHTQASSDAGSAA
ncbi:MAG: 50S ribosomal protein L4 [Aureliella sp.]